MLVRLLLILAIPLTGASAQVPTYSAAGPNDSLAWWVASTYASAERFESRRFSQLAAHTRRGPSTAVGHPDLMHSAKSSFFSPKPAACNRNATQRSFCVYAARPY